MMLPENLNVFREEVQRKIEIHGKQNLLLPCWARYYIAEQLGI